MRPPTPNPDVRQASNLPSPRPSWTITSNWRTGLWYVLAATLQTSASPTPIPYSPPPLPENSIYQLESSWRQDDGRTITLRDLRGKPRVLAMFFSKCDNVCPMITGQLKVLERDMPPSLRKKTGFVLVTLDTEGDGVKELAAYRKRMAYPVDSWVLLAGSQDDTRELANVLGVTYKPMKDDGQIDHDGLIVVLDALGRIRKSTTGITDRKAFVKLLEKLAKE